MKKIMLSMAGVILLLAGCGQTDKQKTGEEKKPAEKTYFEEVLENNLQYSMEIIYDDEGTEQTEAGTFELAKPIKVIAKVTNTGEKDYTFDGNPCDGELTISLFDSKENIKAEGTGDITPDMCIEPLVQHTIKAGETMEAEAVFNMEKGFDHNSTDLSQTKADLKTGEYTITAVYGKQELKETIKITK